MILHTLTALLRRLFRFVQQFLLESRQTFVKGVDKTRTSFTALVIGIDTYEHAAPTFPSLQGAVADAKDITEFLVDTLGVPKSSVVTLYNEAATRERILRELLSLESNDSIVYGDPILIFFAGYGATATSNLDRPTQMLLPYDFVPNSSNRQSAQGVSDVTLHLLLSRLAQAKGGNITVVLDTCYTTSSLSSSYRRWLVEILNIEQYKFEPVYSQRRPITPH